MSAPSIVQPTDSAPRCSVHGPTVIVTFGKWSGRRMLECFECGAYVVLEESEQ